MKITFLLLLYKNLIYQSLQSKITMIHNSWWCLPPYLTIKIFHIINYNFSKYLYLLEHFPIYFSKVIGNRKYEKWGRLKIY